MIDWFDLGGIVVDLVGGVIGTVIGLDVCCCWILWAALALW